ncbi:MAG: L-histidine N(alpha)-methyltransferase [Pseudomonadota bacterium]
MDANVDLNSEEFAEAIRTGLQATPKSLSSMYFYDDRGSELFQAISRHSDYYLTSTEHSILTCNADVIFDSIDCEELDVVELGAGDGHKTQILLNAFSRGGKSINYYPIDISEEAVRLLEDGLDLPSNVTLNSIVADHFSGLDRVGKESQRTKLVLFLGSSIGNFNQKDTVKFLKDIASHLCAGDFLLIGFDLKKDINRLIRAYNDEAGLTEAFNKNLLNRINRELGGHFDTELFQHFGTYNPVIGAMESYLVAQSEQTVAIDKLNLSVHFKAWEPIHLEYSFKYSIDDISHFARESDFAVVENYIDPDCLFCDSLWQCQLPRE